MSSISELEFGEIVGWNRHRGSGFARVNGQSLHLNMGCCTRVIRGSDGPEFDDTKRGYDQPRVGDQIVLVRSEESVAKVKHWNLKRHHDRHLNQDAPAEVAGRPVENFNNISDEEAFRLVAAASGRNTGQSTKPFFVRPQRYFRQPMRA